MPCWACFASSASVCVGSGGNLNGPGLALIQRPLSCNAVLAAVHHPMQAADKPGWV